MVKLKDPLWILGLLLVEVTLSWAAAVSAGGTEVARSFHGTVRENAQPGDEVTLDDGQLRAFDTPSAEERICGYTVYKSGVAPVPFNVVLLDRHTGSAKIVVSNGFHLDYEQKQSYDFDVAADDCISGSHGPRDHIHITVEDVNEFIPEWKDQTYVAEVTEGRIENRILQLDAADADGSEKYSKICHYHLLTPDVPFQINTDGVLRNTEPLDYAVKHNFILEVKAEDCGGHMSKKLLVNIVVKPACQNGWTGIVDHIDYVPGSGRQLLAKNASLELCDEAACKPTRVTVTVKLAAAEDSSNKCEVDADSIAVRNQFCGTAMDAVDVLKLAPPDELSENGVVAFDGKSVAVDVKDHDVFGAGGLATQFTISTWLRHEHGDGDQVKQHVMCSSDAEGMNRHHFAVFVHNCRLVLLLRQEPGHGVDLNTFKPAEWRWKLSQVCDGQWHHYAISVDFPQVRLYVDGRLFVADKHNSAIIDDWPLHPTKRAKGSRLIVGACWEGVGHRLSQHLHGELAGLLVLNNHTEADHVIQCINSCEQKLDFHAINEMETGMSLSMNSDMSRLAINGHTKQGVEKLVDRIGYVNSHTKPLVGHSAVTFDTDVSCGDGSKPKIQMVTVTVKAAAVKPKYIITLGGTTEMVREERDVQHGTAIFRDVLILAMPAVKTDEEDADVDMAEASSLSRLDSCTVQVDPPMTETMEHLRMPENLMNQLHIVAAVTPTGLVLTGDGRSADYVEVLRGIHFVHRRPEDINTRTFRLTCIELRDHYASNQLAVQLSVVHRDPEQKQPAVGHAFGVDRIVHRAPSVDQNRVKKLSGDNVNHSAQSSGTGIAVIAVVCIGFLVFLIILGVARIRSTQKRTVEVNMEERQEMEWDNSALNITVNPLDHETAYDESELNVLQATADSDADSDDEIGSFHDDGPDSSDQDAIDEDADSLENGGKAKDHDLEWDSSTVSY